MPLKRSASNTSSSGSKKAKRDSNAESGSLRTMKSTRWSRVSGSGNADAAYKSSIEDPVKAYSYVCVCRLPLDDGDDRKDGGDRGGEDDRENEDEDEEETSKAPCDGGKTCLADPPLFDYSIDDSSAVYATLVLAGRTFLAMLAQLEHLDLLKPDSEVKNLGFIMALYIKLAATEDILDLEDVTDEIKKNNGTDETFTFVRSNFPSHILAYAKKYNIIKLVGPTDIDEVVEDLEDGAELPERDEKPFGDPWNLRWKTRPGGDALDITTWSSADRKKASFDGKDPLGKEERDAIKKGLVMSLA
ncbi:hypothetical protein KXW25_006949 [Aspergillus fumigatus]|nr:hypothetical protein KXW25_006949 [Aspergillus fumigatus]KAH3017757.1 hypothetical protein KXW60_006923 [Aspergillus fumigatus]KAH3200171.1 hypothetical protein KXW62_000464 [Aspergillus fumigatus]KAH3275969.1 hypothetical protein KXW55_006582 [Aspergillus fumigatus]KAJ8197804.1 hypothetical protein LV157_001382 [Aspergillus fumigatus]